MRESGVDGIMLGRAVLGNPWLAEQIRDLLEGREARPQPAAAERLLYALHHYRVMVEEWGEERAVPQMRKHLGYYLKGFPGASELRERVMRTATAEETLAAVEETIARLEREAMVAA
jgi:tRNA-dihydrouridine synthase